MLFFSFKVHVLCLEILSICSSTSFSTLGPCSLPLQGTCTDGISGLSQRGAPAGAQSRDESEARVFTVPAPSLGDRRGIAHYPPKATARHPSGHDPSLYRPVGWFLVIALTFLHPSVQADVTGFHTLGSQTTEIYCLTKSIVLQAGCPAGWFPLRPFSLAC